MRKSCGWVLCWEKTFLCSLAVSKLWKFNKEVSIKLYGDSAFIFDFNNDEDRKKVLDTGHFLISDKLFTLQPWSYMLEKYITEVKSVPIWVLTYGVPLHMWDKEGLGLISSYLGKPLFADDCTINQDRLAFARVCIEVDVDFSYPENIPLLIDGKIAFDLPVEYQWKPYKCDVCKVFGHSSKDCGKKKKNKRVPKKVCRPDVSEKGNISSENASTLQIFKDMPEYGSNKVDNRELVEFSLNNCWNICYIPPRRDGGGMFGRPSQ